MPGKDTMPPKTNHQDRYSKLRIFLFSVFALLFTTAYPQSDQEKTTQERHRNTKPGLESKLPQETEAAGKDFKIGVSVDLILLYASVFDDAGRFVSGLNKENFKLYEDGVAQEILSFSQDDVPVSMGLLLDLSGSMRGKFDQVTKSARAFIQASNPQDQVFLIGFNDEVDLLQDYTSDIDEINDALENASIMGGTALYDAIYLGVQKAHTGIKPKKAVVVITDGDDRDSYYTRDEMISKVRESDVQVFSIGFLDEAREKSLFGGLKKSKPEKAQEGLSHISEETGGKAFFPQKIEELPGIVAEIASELRRQYSVSYLSSNGARDGTYRRIKIELGGKISGNSHIRCRRGYYAPKAEITQK